MRIVIQRVSRAAVRVDGETVGAIGYGLLLLVGAEKGETVSDLPVVVDKIVNLRIFSDADGKMNLSIKQTGGEVLLVSQFTLAGSIKKGRRPSFDGALPKDEAEPLLETFADLLRREGVAVRTGTFGAMMTVDLVNDGPVTFVLDHPVDPVHPADPARDGND